MENSLMVASMISFIPAILMLFFSLKKYEGYFEDRKLFLSFVGSLFVGMFVAVLHLYTTRFDNATYINPSGAYFYLVIIAFAAAENLLFLIILNMSFFGQKYDTSFYGAPLGLGIGAMIVVAQLYAFFEFDFRVNPDLVFSVIFFMLSTIIMHGALGIYIGFGCYKYHQYRNMGIAFLLALPFNGLIFFWYWYAFNTWAVNVAADGPNTYNGGWEFLLIALVWALVVYRHMYKNILPASLPEKLKRHRRRMVRKRKRTPVVVPRDKD